MFSDDLVMKIGNQFRVLERTKYGILIEEICDNNTYFVERGFRLSVSNRLNKNVGR